MSTLLIKSSKFYSDINKRLLELNIQKEELLNNIQKDCFIFHLCKRSESLYSEMLNNISKNLESIKKIDEEIEKTRVNSIKFCFVYINEQIKEINDEIILIPKKN